MSSSCLSPSVFKTILPALVTTIVALDYTIRHAVSMRKKSKQLDLDLMLAALDRSDDEDEISFSDDEERVDHLRGRDSRSSPRQFNYDLAYFLIPQENEFQFFLRLRK